MARKTDNRKYIHEFTSQIHPSRRVGTIFAGMPNRDERAAKASNSLSCHDCLHFKGGCSEYLGKYHQPCRDFEWW